MDALALVCVSPDSCVSTTCRSRCKGDCKLWPGGKLVLWKPGWQHPPRMLQLGVASKVGASFSGLFWGVNVEVKWSLIYTRCSINSISLKASEEFWVLSSLGMVFWYKLPTSQLGTRTGKIGLSSWSSFLQAHYSCPAGFTSQTGSPGVLLPFPHSIAHLPSLEHLRMFFSASLGSLQYRPDALKDYDGF